MDFLTRERGRCALVFESIGGTVEDVQRLALEYKAKPCDRLAVKIWSAIAIALEAHYRRYFGSALTPEDAWQLGYVAVSRSLKYWDAGRKRVKRNAGDPSQYLSYAVTSYRRQLVHELQERGTIVKIERNTKGWFDRYNAIRNGLVRVDHVPFERVEELGSWGDL